MRREFGYFTPEDHYEALLDRLVAADTEWLDVGCGRSIFSSNDRLAAELSSRCRRLVGLDPDPNIEDNPFVHERTRCPLDTFAPEEPFDLVTLRMVVEHFDEPGRALAALGRLTRPGGRVVVYTVHQWSPVPLLTRVTPEFIKHELKRRFWNAEERDTFPVHYRLNTRRKLRNAFENAGFAEVSFASLDDCRTLANFRWGLRGELALRAVLGRLGRAYPERCLLGVYERQP